MRNVMVCLCVLLGVAGIRAEDAPFEHPLLAQAVRAQETRDFEAAQTLFERYIAELPEAERILYKEISRIGSPADIKIYTQASEEAKIAVLDRFWDRVDPSPLTRANERLIEHYRRVAYARAKFGEGRFPWDDRGEVYVRFGPPDHVSSSGDIQIEMDRAVQDARRDFVSRRRLSLSVQPGQPIFPVPSHARWTYWVYLDLDGGTEFTFISRFRRTLYEFAPIPDGLDVSLVTDVMAYHGGFILRDISARKPAIYTLNFSDLPVDFYYYPATFRGEGEQTRLEIYYGFPASEIVRLPVNEQVDRILLDRGVALFDSAWSEVHRVSDQLTFHMPSEQQILAGAFVPGVLSFEAEPGLHYLAFQVRDVVSGKSQVYQQALALDDYSDRDRLMMSDIELAFWVAPAEEEGSFVKHGLKVIPMASKSFRKDQNAFVFFEIYNLTRDAFGQTRYRVEYTFRARERGAAPVRALRGVGRMLRLKEQAREIAIAYEQTGDKADDKAYVELDLQDVSPGGQLVRVSVTDLLSDREVHKEMAFEIAP